MQTSKSFSWAHMGVVLDIASSVNTTCVIVMVTCVGACAPSTGERLDDSRSAFSEPTTPIDDVGVDLEHAGPEQEGTSMEEPLEVFRDNPHYAGWLELLDGMSGQSSYEHSHNGTWTGLQGQVWAYEFNATGNLVGTSTMNAPLLPAQGSWFPPDPALWATRTTKLVPSNAFKVEQWHYRTATGEDRFSNAPLWVRLSDQVLVVPVLVVNFQPGEDNTSPAVTWPQREAEALFDFIPNVNSPLASPYANPSVYEDPPDDIWTQCNIQFQVVFATTLNWDGQPNCSTDSGELVFSEDDDEQANVFWEKFAAKHTTALRDALEGNVVIAQYGHFDCNAGHPGGFAGKTSWVPDPTRNGLLSTFIQITVDPDDRIRNVTGHELGHVLLGPDHSPSGQPQLLMHATSAGTEITPDQCTLARSTEKGLAWAELFDNYNHAIGRVVTPPSELDFDDTLPETALADSRVCCEDPESGYRFIDFFAACAVTGENIIRALGECSNCCLRPDNSVETLPAGECTPANTLDRLLCNKVCCEDGSSYSSEYLYDCLQHGAPTSNMQNCGPVE